MSEELVDRLASSIHAATTESYLSLQESRACARACLTELSAAGYAVVKREPDEAMDAAWREVNGGLLTSSGSTWRAMLSAGEVKA